MLKRIIPILLLKNDELVKSVQFDNYTYIGDIINAVKIYNELEVDELLILDTDATREKKKINFSFLQQIATECFVPLSYGGGIYQLETIEQLLKTGIEKVCIGSAAQNKSFLTDAVSKFGSSTISVCVDYKYIQNEPTVFYTNGKIGANVSVFDFIKILESIGVGEIVLQNIEKDGTYSGYDIELLEKCVGLVSNPIIIAGGGKDHKNIQQALKKGASAAAAGSLFVYYTNNRGILINYPDQQEMEEIGLTR